MDAEAVRKQAEFERLFLAARVCRMRGDYQQAQALINQALQLQPENLDAREFAADILFARGELEKALEEYKSILQVDRSRASAEEKYAKIVVELAEAKRQKELLKKAIENPQLFKSSYSLPPRSPLVAAVLSGIPGLGHVYCGQYTKGVLLFLSVTISWLIFLTVRPNVSGSPDPIARFVQNLNVTAVFFLCLALTLHLYALLDASLAAERSHRDNL
ncbi:MAG: tetratricopeptide repeat protein [Armatimonadota bacterium]|nr:tetratricopeptide repeat protein [Armatimonadota bacterium]